MTDLSVALTVARSNVQTFAEALSFFDADELDPFPSPSLTPPVSGTRDPQAPYTGDAGLRAHVIAALRECHFAAIALCEIDWLTDPQPYDEAPGPHRALPPLPEAHAHLRHLDASLGEVQRFIHGLSQDHAGAALRACELLTNPEVSHRSWDALARRRRMQCLRCDRPAGRAELCQQCDTGKRPCVGISEPCGRDVQDRGSRCYACRKRLSKMTNEQIREMMA